MKTVRFVALALASVLLVGAPAGAASIPLTALSSFPTATFGGTGIPTDAVAVTTFVDGGNTITLALAAFGRFANPQLTNDGAGTFFAAPGLNDGLEAVPHSLGATWNFGYYVSISGGGTFSNYDIDLLYDLAPGSNTPVANLGRIDFDLLAPAATLVQDSQNPFFAFLGGVPPVPGVTPPSGFPPATFDPFAAGQYTFALRVSSLAGVQLGQAAIDVDVAAVPEPASMLLLGTGLLGLAARRRARKTRG